jgi:NSS family neurotransmitter:Na+ symporter
MGLAGRLIGTAFFLALVVGALTSAISLLEVLVSASMDAFRWERRRAAWMAGLAVTIAGAWSAFDLDVLDVADSIAINLFLLGGGLGLAVFVGWIMADPIGEASSHGRDDFWLHAWRGLLRFVVPVVLLFILYHSLPETWEKLVALLGRGG